MILSNKDELRAYGLQSLTEIKFENTINRANGKANPRQIERAVRGSRFDLDIIYGVEKEDEILEDITILAEGMKLLQYDYLGGSGSRGYGKVGFEDIAAEVVIGEVDDAIMEQCNEILKQKTE
jgi:CRISPR-associated protein Csm3